MTLAEFQASIPTGNNPAAELTPALAALWWDAKGDWEKAHESAQNDEGLEGA